MNTVIKICVCFALSLALAACGHGWKHNTIPEAKWDKDYADCVYRAESATKAPRVTKDPAQTPAAYGEARYLIDKCMEEKGYYQAGGR